MGWSVAPGRMRRAIAVASLALVMALGAGAGSASAGPAAGQGSGSGASSIPLGPEFAGVSCWAVSSCLAVGEATGGLDLAPVAATWNGSKWQWQAQPAEPQAGSQLGAVACLSATSCVAIGNTNAAAISGGGAAFGEEWNGASWKLMAPMAGTTFARALGLSCVTAAYCVAVGGSGSAPPTAHAVAEFWNGKSWVQLSPVVPAGATALTFDSVSCASKSHCLAAGSYVAGGTEFAVAESWERGKWTNLAVPAGFTAFAGIACPGLKLCLAVAPGPAAALWNGTTWSKLTTPIPFGDGVSLNGISCSSVTSCVAVGGGEFGAISDKWTGGTSLTRLTFVKSAGGVPDLSAVSCSGAASCIGVGNPIGEFTPGGEVAGTWSGARWRAIQPNRVDSLAAVSCLTSSSCLAVGGYHLKWGNTEPLAESWDGSAWKLVNPLEVSTFTGVSCLNTTFCLAEGPGVTAVWSGTGWQEFGSGTGALQDDPAVSCGTTRFCLATGGPSRLVRWDGLSWHSGPVRLPVAAAAGSGQMFALSCLTKSFCLAVGSYSGSSAGGHASTLANIWNGRRWVLLGSPHPGTDSVLTSVSCVTGPVCMAIGSSLDAQGDADNLAMTYSGGKWQVVTMPGGFGAVDPADPFPAAGSASVSCSDATDCVAVGSFPGSRQPELVEVWNGTTWRVTQPAGPATGLASVSCSSPTFCLAVGATGNLALTESWNGSAWKLLTEPSV